MERIGEIVKISVTSVCVSSEGKHWYFSNTVLKDGDVREGDRVKLALREDEWGGCFVNNVEKIIPGATQQDDAMEQARRDAAPSVEALQAAN